MWNRDVPLISIGRAYIVDDEEKLRSSFKRTLQWHDKSVWQDLTDDHLKYKGKEVEILNTFYYKTAYVKTKDGKMLIYPWEAFEKQT